MKAEAVQVLFKLGLPTQAITRAYAIYSEELIDKVVDHLTKTGYKFVYDFMFFKKLNEFAGLYPRKELMGQKRICSQRGPRSVGSILASGEA